MYSENRGPCVEGALVVASLLYAAQGVSVILEALANPPSGTAATFGLLALGVAEIAAAALASTRAGIPLGAAASWLLVLLDGSLLPLGTPAALEASLAVAASALSALGWQCLSPAGRAASRGAAGEPGGPASGEGS